MNINFPPVDEKFIKDKIKSGYYSNATELVRDAVRQLRERTTPNDGTESKRRRLQAALQAGLDDIAGGRLVEYDKSFMKKTLAEVKKMAAAGVDYDPDVIGPEGQEPWA